MKRPWERNGRIIEDAAGRPIECEVCPCGIPGCPSCADNVPPVANSAQTAQVDWGFDPCGVAVPRPHTLNGKWYPALSAWWFGWDETGWIDLGDGNYVSVYFYLRCAWDEAASRYEWFFDPYFRYHIADCAADCTPPALADCTYHRHDAQSETLICLRSVDGVLRTDGNIHAVVTVTETGGIGCWCFNSIALDILFNP